MLNSFDKTSVGLVPLQLQWCFRVLSISVPCRPFVLELLVFPVSCQNYSCSIWNGTCILLQENYLSILILCELGPILWHLWHCKKSWVWLIPWKITYRRECYINCTWKKTNTESRFQIMNTAFFSVLRSYMSHCFGVVLCLSSNLLCFLNVLGAVKVRTTIPWSLFWMIHF